MAIQSEFLIRLKKAQKVDTDVSALMLAVGQGKEQGYVVQPELLYAMRDNQQLPLVSKHM